MRNRKTHFIHRIVVLFLIVSALLQGCNPSDENSFYQFTQKENCTNIEINIHDFGTVKIRLFNEASPELTEIFISKIKNGYFNGNSFYSVINEYCSLFGDSESDASVEFTTLDTLYPFEGALCSSINSESKAYSDKFFFVNMSSSQLSQLEELLNYKGVSLTDYIFSAYNVTVTDKELNYYRSNGGCPWLKGHCVIIGQVYEGMDVISRVNEVSTEQTGDYVPDKNIIIDSINIIQ